MRSSFVTMAQQQDVTQITFFYDFGHSESYTIPISPVTLAQELSQMLSQPWITFHLMDQTVMVCTSKVIKVEIKPPLPEFVGENVFQNSERVTPLQLGAIGRLEPTA